MNNPSDRLVELWRAFEATRIAWLEGSGTVAAFDEAKAAFLYASSREVMEAVKVRESLTSPAVLESAA